MNIDIDSLSIENLQQVYTLYQERMKQQIIEKVNECWNIAKAFWPKSMGNCSVPPIHFDLKGRVAGTCSRHSNKLRFNLELATKYPSDYISDIVPHEVAHAVCHIVYGSSDIQPHGALWQFICKRLGGTGKRCHEFAVTPARRTEKWEYSCSCGKKSYFGKNIRKKMLLGRKFRCPSCLRYLEITNATKIQ